MKRILCLILALLLVFSLSACKKQKEETPSDPAENTYDLVECMNQGKLPEAEYLLGTDPEKIKTDYNYYGENSSDEHSHDHEIYMRENPNSTNIVVGDYYYYFVNGQESKGISSIVCFGTAFGTEVNGFETKDDIKKKFSTVEFTEREISSLQAYFIPGEVENCTALTCKTENRRIDFVFMEETLIAINLVDTENWTLT